MQRKIGLYLGFFLLFGIFLSSLAGEAAAKKDLSELRITQQDQQGVTVTIYNDNLALVRDQRHVRLPSGESLLALDEVSGAMLPETALLRKRADAGTFRVLEQNFDFDPLTPRSLLEKYVGQTVMVVRVHPQTGVESTEPAQVLAADGGVVLKMGNRIETEVPGRLVYPEVPKNLRHRPTLVIRVANDLAGNQELELSYLTKGLSWQTDYVAELDDARNRLDLSGWVTITNQSGAEYSDARLQFVAGDVHRAAGSMDMMERDGRVMKMMSAADESGMNAEGLLDYHLYNLQRPTTLRDKQVKQVALLSAMSIPVTREYVLRGDEYYYRGRHGEIGTKLKAATYLQFINNKESGLGMPLPKGIMRVYMTEAAGSSLFVGEDRIDHTPMNETVRLRLGDAFDVSADRIQTDFKKLASGPNETLIESAYRIELRNAKTQPITVKVEEPMPGDWQILQENSPHKKEDARTAVWQVTVPAESKVELTYRVRIRF